jgi:transcriptional regulatory protein LevR
LAAAGVRLFEVFLTKDGDSQYQQHSVYLYTHGNGTADSIVGFSNDVLHFENMLGAASKDMKLELDILEENSDEGDKKNGS